MMDSLGPRAPRRTGILVALAAAVLAILVGSALLGAYVD